MAKRKHEMTQEAAQLIIDMISVENGLHLRADPKGVLLAAALAGYRRHLEHLEGFLRVRPDPALACLKYITIEQGLGWLKLIDTRVQKKK